MRAVVACPAGGLGYDDVMAWCRAHLPEHKVPRSVVLVSAIPRTSRGKISREELLALVGAAGDASGHEREAWRLPPFLRASVGLHAAGAAALVLAPERWPLVVGGLLLDHAVIGAGASGRAARSSGPT